MKKKHCIKKCGGVTDDFAWLELEVYKYFNGFDNRFIGHNLYLPIVARKLNNYHYTKIFEDKCLISQFSKVFDMPNTVCCSIGGDYFDSKMKSITGYEVDKLVHSIHRNLIIKPTRESSGGKGVIRLAGESFNRKDFGKDWIIQECVHQCDEFSFFKDSSLNTLRITSLCLNGRVSICNIIFRFGNKGSIVDNFGSGGNLIGVHNDGTLYDFAFNHKLEKFDCINNTSFSELSFDFIPSVLDLVRKAHEEDFSLCNYVGWDIAIDKNGYPVLIEVNSSQPGIFMEQLATGIPAFNGREQEVLDYIKNKEFTYKQ